MWHRAQFWVGHLFSELNSHRDLKSVWEKYILWQGGHTKDWWKHDEMALGDRSLGTSFSGLLNGSCSGD